VGVPYSYSISSKKSLAKSVAEVSVRVGINRAAFIDRHTIVRIELKTSLVLLRVASGKPVIQSREICLKSL
jgi:hypothetical protein